MNRNWIEDRHASDEVVRAGARDLFTFADIGRSLVAALVGIPQGSVSLSSVFSRVTIERQAEESPIA